MRFKVGDKVFLRRGSIYYRQAGEFEVGVITKIFNYFDFLYAVKWEKSLKEYGYKEVDLRPVIIANKLNRKLYPNCIEKDGYLFKV